MTTNKVDITKYYRSVFSDSGGSRFLSEEELLLLKNSDNLSTAVSLESGENISVDIDLNVPVTSSGVRLSRLQSKSFSPGIKNNVSFSASQDGGVFTSVGPVLSSYDQTNSKSSLSLDTRESNDQVFCNPAGKLVRVIDGENVLRVYNPNTNSWSAISLPFSLGFPTGGLPRITASTIEPVVFIARGDGTSNWHSVNLNTQVVKNLEPSPIVWDIAGPSGQGNALAFDSLRNWVYTWVGNPTDGNSLHVYDVNIDVWVYADNSFPENMAWILHVPDVDLLFALAGFSGSSVLKRWSPVSLTLSSSSTFSTNNQKGRSASYRSRDGLIYFGQEQGFNAPFVVHAISPKFEGAYAEPRIVIQSPSPLTVNFPVKVSYDETNDVFYFWATNYRNNTFEFTTKPKNTYYVDNIADTPYRFLRYTQSAGSTNEIEVFGSESAFVGTGTAPGEIQFPGVPLGLPSEPIQTTVENTGENSTTDTIVFIEPDGSEASRYLEISPDGAVWFPHCVHNDLSSFKCFVKNNNYDTALCGYLCTQSNGGPLAEGGFTSPSLSIGPILSSGTEVFYSRGHVPGHASVGTREVNVGVEMIFDDG
jgi:hypothetical protein